MKYKALLIGLGRIGMGYDYIQKAGSELTILSHAQALDTHAKFELAGGVDINIECREAFCKKFKKPTFENLQEALQIDSFDLIVIATDTNSHLEIFKAVLEHAKPKLVVLEKPLAYITSESRAIIDEGRKAGVPVAVNYFRAYEPVYQRLRSQLQDGHLGYPLTAIVRYTNGMINNGSHWLHFILPIFGKFQGVGYASISPTFDGDFFGDLKLNFERGTAHFISFEQAKYYLFEIDIYGPLGKITIDSRGNHVSEYLIIKDPDFPNEISLVENPNLSEPNTGQYQSFVYDNIHTFLDSGVALSCSLESLVDMTDVYSEIEKKLKVEKNVS